MPLRDASDTESSMCSKVYHNGNLSAIYPQPCLARAGRVAFFTTDDYKNIRENNVVALRETFAGEVRKLFARAMRRRCIASSFEYDAEDFALKSEARILYLGNMYAEYGATPLLQRRNALHTFVDSYLESWDEQPQTLDIARNNLWKISNEAFGELMPGTYVSTWNGSRDRTVLAWQAVPNNE